ncbi:MAG: sulfatase-like hydrolase/transferase [Spirochaetales bacterium]|nr:sulfatase-like hydrolase/transferase [Spirochaetales bacterium]
MQNKPNILFICAEHWPGQLLGSAGNAFVQTPTLDEIASCGIRFSEAYSATPTCIPARRSIMTGTKAKTHGDRIFNETLPMPKDIPTLAEAFKNAGYQTYAVGKMHVYPQRNRIGFDDVILHEEGRHHLGLNKDDYEIYLAEEGYSGQEQVHGMGVNEYVTRPWQLPEYLHPTFWATRNMCKTIKRKDPTRPAFWYCSYSALHPPVTPPSEYLDIYREIGVDAPYRGEWSGDDNLPLALKIFRHQKPSPGDKKAAIRTRQGMYAQATYLDHQIRLIIGTLREEGILDNTIIVFTADHGDMLGNHDFWAKPAFFEYAAKVPLIIVDTADYKYGTYGEIDSRLCGHEDIMPTLLEMCGINAPETVEGISLLGDKKRSYYYGEHFEDERAMRMIRKDEYKLIYYPYGNRFQLFNLSKDPDELVDLSSRENIKSVMNELKELLKQEIYGSDLRWIKKGELVGSEENEYSYRPNRGLTAQRGWRF